MTNTDAISLFNTCLLTPVYSSESLRYPVGVSIKKSNSQFIQNIIIIITVSQKKKRQPNKDRDRAVHILNTNVVYGLLECTSGETIM